MYNSIIEINSSQFILNLKAIAQQVTSKVKLCLPVKANAYGHGLVEISKIAQPYVDYLGVSSLEEGETLRQQGISIPILVFGAISELEIPNLIINNLEITISSQFKAKLVANYCKSINVRCKVHLKIDTGMNRIGVRAENAKALIDEVLNMSELDLVGVYSHLASSDDINSPFTFKQINKFKVINDYIKKIDPRIICHLANSAGTCYFTEAYFDMVRPGILAYGYFPAEQVNYFPFNQIKPCFSLKSKITFFKVIQKDEGISYNQKYISKDITRVVTIPIGYGDGYRRILSDQGEVLIRGQKYIISGNICMDMFMVDISFANEAYVGDEVVLIGKQQNQEITLQSIANKCSTIIYEILCGFNERIPRIYL